MRRIILRDVPVRLCSPTCLYDAGDIELSFSLFFNSKGAKMSKIYSKFNGLDILHTHYEPESSIEPICFRGKTGNNPRVFWTTSDIKDVTCDACKFMTWSSHSRWLYRQLILLRSKYCSRVFISRVVG